MVLYTGIRGNMNTKEKIYLCLTDKLSAHHLTVDDETPLHASHAEAEKTGGGHYKITVVSDCFQGKTSLKRHRMVYDALKEELKEEIHALGIKAYTSEEWNKL